MYGKTENERRIVETFFEEISFGLKEHEYCEYEIRMLFDAIREGDEEDITEAACELSRVIREHDERDGSVNPY